jgi:hypothetical protein
MHHWLPVSQVPYFGTKFIASTSMIHSPSEIYHLYIFSFIYTFAELFQNTNVAKG